MPKVKLSRFSAKDAPPIDWLWAAVLERKTVLGYDLKQIAEAGGCSYDIMRRYIRKSPWSWPPEVRAKVCAFLGLQPQISVVQGGTVPHEVVRQKGVRA